MNLLNMAPDLIFDRREAVGLDTETGITADADIQQLDAYTDIDPPVGVSEEEFTEVLGVLHQAVKAKARQGFFVGLPTRLVDSISGHPR